MLTAIIDFSTQLIPDEITVAHLVGAWLFLIVCYGSAISPGWLSSLIGMFVLSLFFFAADYLSLRLLGKPGFGMGDVKLALGLGVLFGWQLVIGVGFFGVCLGGIVGIVVLMFLKISQRYQFGVHIPFGPYLAISAFVWMFLGYEITHWYLSLFRTVPTSVQ